MEFLMFLTGFFWNIISMLISILPMSYDVGMICMTKKKYIWEIDELELLEQLDKGDPFEQ